jgi:hypothetical protein
LIQARAQKASQIQLIHLEETMWCDNEQYIQVETDKTICKTSGKTEAKIGDRINCTVEVERIGSRGWGMMIAEVGLPPGADVERSSIQEAIFKSGLTKIPIDAAPVSRTYCESAG